MHTAALLFGIVLIAAVLWDAFETILLPRSIVRRLRLVRAYFQATWKPWTLAAASIRSEPRRDRFTAVYGPLSLLGLTAIWAAGLVTGFAIVQWGAGSRLHSPDGAVGFRDDLYMSGSTFFTLGLGDVRPIGRFARFLTVVEAGTGFAFLAVVVAYFPVLYQSFSRREAPLTVLDAWAGSPPAAAEALRRVGEARELRSLDEFLKRWEQWCAETLESHISYPAVAFFRSQHQRQSWVAALTSILDLTALVIAGIDGVSVWQARLTFAVARHAAVDLAQVLRAPPRGGIDRLPPPELERVRRQLEAAGLRPDRSPAADARLRELRESYEPYVNGLGQLLMMPLPPWVRDGTQRDNWQTSPKRDAGTHF
jgi:Ion channel